jgi:two-component system chemotaxis response regulator CheB
MSGGTAEPRRAARRVLVLGPEPIIRLQLQHLLAAQPGLAVSGPSRGERDLDAALAEGRADILLVDARSDPNGAAATLQGAARRGLPVVVLHDGRPLQGVTATQLERPAELTGEPPDGAFAQRLLAALLPGQAPAAPRRPRAGPAFRPKLIAFGSSTGGPEALSEVLHALARHRLPQPMVLTQHMPPNFTGILADRITRCGIPAVEAADGMKLLPGRMHVAPGGRHLLFQREREELSCLLDDGPPENFCRPAVDPMLRSAVRHWRGGVLAVILTGMGSDGLAGCQEVVSSGGLVLAQDEPTSVVWGMPGAVARAGICHAILPLGAIAEAVARLALGGVA